MRRITTGILLALAAAFAFGCGGSSAPAPGGGNDTGGASEFNEYGVPDSIEGSYSVSNLPGQVNVVATDDRDKLEAIADKYGYGVLKFDAGYGTLSVPVGSEDAAITMLEKEFAIISAEPVRVINTPKFNHNQAVRKTSFYPVFPDYGEVIFGLGVVQGAFTPFANFVGQAWPMNAQHFNGGWQVTIENNAVATQPVSIAIIDAGWFDYSIDDQPGLNDVADDANGVPGTVLDVANSGAVDGSGNFTAGLPAATWELDANNFPLRTNGAMMLGALAGGSDGFLASVQGVDLDDPADGVQDDEVWNIGIMGANPNATFMLVKTGTNAGGTWTFSDNEIAESIDHAVGAGADIVLLGMFAPGTVSANVSAAIANARANNALVIAPAGDVIASFDDNGTPNDGADDFFADTPVDIQVDSVTPASDPNVVSVAGGGVNRIPDNLGDVDFGDGPFPNPGTGWFPNFRPLVGQDFRALATWSNSGATIASTGFGLGFGPAPFLVDGSNNRFPGIVYTNFIDQNFGSWMGAAYVAGAASMVFQTLSEVNGTPPTDEEVLAELLSTVQFRGMTGVDDPTTAGPDDGGLLNAGLAVTSAVNGGSLVDVLPAMQLTTIQASQPFGFVTRGTDFSLTINLVNGTAPFELTVDWGDGSPDTVIANWTPGDVVTKTGGYDELGLFAINILVTDDNGLSDVFALGVNVQNPLAATITVENANGQAVPATSLKAGTEYRFNSNAGNIYSGDGNVTTFSWDFNGDATEDESGPAPTFTFPSAGNYTITLTIIETLRPDTVRTLDVIVAP